MDYKISELDEALNVIRGFAVAGVLAANGEIVGYQIQCPECKETTNTPFADFNYDTESECPICKHKFLQKDNIVGIVTRKSIEEYDDEGNSNEE